MASTKQQILWACVPMRVALITALAAFIAVVQLAPAHAVPIALYEKDVHAFRPDGTGPTTQDFTTQNLSVSYGGFSASATSVDGPDLSLSASVACTIASCAGPGVTGIVIAGGFSTITYYFTIVGPNSGSVPIDIVGTADLAQSGDTNSRAGISLNYAPTGTSGGAGFICVGSPSGPGCGTHPFLLTGLVPTFPNGDTVSGTIIIGVEANAYYPYLGFPYSAAASIDPYIYIDPVFLAANPDNSVIVSPGIGNSAPSAITSVPETGTLALFGTGLLSLGVISRRRRKVHRST